VPTRRSTTQHLGAKLGPRIAHIVSETMGEHLYRTAAYRARIGAEAANEFFRGMTREKRQHTTPLWELFMGGEATPDEVEKVLNFVAHGSGELSEWINAQAVAGATQTAMTAAIANYLSPLNQGLIAAAPYSVLDTATIARASVQEIPYGTIDYYAEAARGGLNATRFNILRALQESYPSLAELIELWRRGLVNQETVEYALKRNQVPHSYIPVLLNLKREHIGVPDAALAVLRGHLTEAEGEAIAELSGMTPEDFKTIIYNTGEPPGLMQMLEGLRRGFISDSELQKGIRQSRVRDEWIPLVEKLRFSPASPADAVNAVVQGHLPEDTAKQIAEWGGLRPEDFGWLVENAGNPMSNMQAIELWNRGVISQQRVEEAIREGRTKDKYIQNMLSLRVKIPPPFEVVKMVSTGGVSPSRGAELLHHSGYESDVVTGLVHAATSEQATKAKALAQSQVEELYEELAISEAEALQHLRVLGISEANGRLILRVADLKRERKLIDAAMTPIKTQYTARHIDEAEASTYLDKLGVPSGQRDLYLSLWTIERASKREVLTPAQVVGANKLGLIPDTAAEQRLVDHGYGLEDARILLDSEKGRTVPAP
jgi:hypothetical protein